MSLQDSAEATIKRWRSIGPAGFAREVLGATPTPQQCEASDALVSRRKVSIRSGHGTGKSTFLAWAILWFMATRFPVKVPCTAPTAHQLSDVLWAEVAKWLRIMRERVPQLADEFEWTSEQIKMRAAPLESFAVARTARPEQPEALQGFHSDNILFIIDEASGVADKVYEVAEGALSTEDAYVIMMANPTRMSGYFYDSHHKMRGTWAALHWNGEESPLVSKQYIESMALRYGADSAIYRVRVRGDFAGAEDGVIPLDLIEPAKFREIKPFGDVAWGVDVARFGSDRTAIAKRRGKVMLEPVKWWAGKDTMQVAGLVKLEYDNAPIKPTVIYVDVIGIGAGVVDRCQELGLPVVGVNVAESPSVEERYNRLRDELWFEARNWFAARDCAMPEDEDLIAELTLPTYKILSSGKIQVESKEDMKKRGVQSPDLADAFCLTFARGGAPRKQWTRPIQYRPTGIV